MELKIGDFVWYYEVFSGMIAEAVIEDITSTGDVATIKGISFIGTTKQLISNLYKTKEEAMSAQKIASEKQICEYKKKIKDVNSLVKFMYLHAVGIGEEYTDYDAIEAAAQRAKEILNIDIRK